MKQFDFKLKPTVALHSIFQSAKVSALVVNQIQTDPFQRKFRFFKKANIKPAISGEKENLNIKKLSASKTEANFESQRQGTPHFAKKALTISGSKVKMLSKPD